MKSNLITKSELIWFIYLILCFLLATSCQKDYADKPSQFNIDDLVKLNGIDPAKSFLPHNGGMPPLKIYRVYLDSMYPNYWFYDTTDANGDTLTHIDNKQLKKWK